MTAPHRAAGRSPVPRGQAGNPSVGGPSVRTADAIPPSTPRNTAVTAPAGGPRGELTHPFTSLIHMANVTWHDSHHFTGCRRHDGHHAHAATRPPRGQRRAVHRVLRLRALRHLGRRAVPDLLPRRQPGDCTPRTLRDVRRRLLHPPRRRPVLRRPRGPDRPTQRPRRDPADHRRGDHRDRPAPRVRLDRHLGDRASRAPAPASGLLRRRRIGRPPRPSCSSTPP